MEKIFQNKKVNTEKLLKFGFEQKGKYFKKEFPVLNGEFLLSVKIFGQNDIETTMTETAANEIYTLHLTSETGAFVGKVREEYEKILNDVAQNCFENSVFKSKYSYALIDYAKEKYDDLPEYLWEKFPDNAVIRRKDNKKWYIAILTVKKDRLGFDSNKNAEVADLRANPEEIPELIKRQGIFPGYHMNKKHWISVILDGSVEIKEIYKMLDISYNLAKK